MKGGHFCLSGAQLLSSNYLDLFAQQTCFEHLLGITYCGPVVKDRMTLSSENPYKAEPEGNIDDSRYYERVCVVTEHLGETACEQN